MERISIPAFCVIAFDPNRQEEWIDLVLADDVRGAVEIVSHLRTNATIATVLDPVRLRELAAATEQLTEQTFAAWVASLHQPTTRQPVPLTIRRWIAGAENYPDIAVGASADELLRAAAGDLSNSAIVDTIQQTVFETSDGRTYALTAEAVLERADREYVEEYFVVPKLGNERSTP